MVYFSVGAIQEAEQLSPQILQSLADAFRELPYTILWKIGNTTMINKSSNVIAEAWFPQQQILGKGSTEFMYVLKVMKNIRHSRCAIPFLFFPFIFSSPSQS